MGATGFEIVGNPLLSCHMERVLNNYLQLFEHLLSATEKSHHRFMSRDDDLDKNAYKMA
jgi:hypothetical protein